MWIVRSFPALSNAFVQSLIHAGQIAGGGGGPSLFDPSKIIEYGLTTTAPLVEKISGIGITEIVNGLVLALTYIGIMLAYILIACRSSMPYWSSICLLPLSGSFCRSVFLNQQNSLPKKPSEPSFRRVSNSWCLPLSCR